MNARDNHWRIFRDKLVAWDAHVPLRADAPEDLLRWTIETIKAFRRHEVWFRKEDGSYWQQDELIASIEQRFEATRVVDAFKFAARFDRVGTKLAYFGDGGIGEELVDDAGKLLERLRPEAGEYTYVDRRIPPLSLKGFDIGFDPASSEGLPAATLPWTTLKIGFQTDVWFPWVPGNWQRDLRPTFYDNRPLAQRHTARLNDLLATVRASVLERGGSWEFVPFSERPWIPLVADEQGIKLDADAPPMELEHRDHSRGATQ